MPLQSLSAILSSYHDVLYDTKGEINDPVAGSSSFRFSLWLSSLAIRAGVQREEGVAGALFEMLCRLFFEVVFRATGRPVLMLVCRPVRPTWPRHPHQRRKHRQQQAATGGRTHEIGHNLRDPKRGSVGPSPHEQARHSSESTRFMSKSNAESTNPSKQGEEGRLRRPRSPDRHRMATTNPSSQVEAWAMNCCESTHWPLAEQSGSRTARVRRVHSVKTSSFEDSISCPLPQGTSTVARACHTPDAV